MLSALLPIIYPSQCSGCAREIRATENQICLHCLHGLCDFETNHDSPVFQLFWGKSDVVHATSCYSFIKGEALQHLIHEFKYKGNKKLAREFGIQMGNIILSSTEFKDVDSLCYVPTSKRKERQRGYNQAHELCKGVALACLLPIVPFVKRTNKVRSQTSKKVHDRHKQLESSFYANPKSSEGNYKHILLIDDVITTGATLSICSKIIIKEFNLKVSVLALAYRDI